MDFRRSLVQLPVTSRMSSEVRPRCSGLYPVRSCKPLLPVDLETVEPLSSACSTTRLSSWGRKFFCHFQSEIFLFPLYLVFQPCTIVKNLTPSPQWPSCRHWELLLSAPSAISSSGWPSRGLSTCHMALIILVTLPEPALRAMDGRQQNGCSILYVV